VEKIKEEFKGVGSAPPAGEEGKSATAQLREQIEKLKLEDERARLLAQRSIPLGEKVRRELKEFFSEPASSIIVFWLVYVVAMHLYPILCELKMIYLAAGISIVIFLVITYIADKHPRR